MKGITVLICLVICLVRGSTSDQSKDEEQYFLNKIFDEYGDSGRMSFEGLEHLMMNLGLGRLKFEKNHSLSMHRIDGNFVEVHDSLNLHRHNHTRQRRSVTITSLKEKCLSPETLLSLYGLEPGHQVSISRQGFMRICPAIVYQLDTRACAAPLPSIKRPETANSLVWMGASVSILIISVSGLIGVAVVPFLEKNVFRRLLSILVALAVGTLVGDALLHLLPHAYGLDDDHMVVIRSSATIMSIMGFFVIEAVINLRQIKKKKKKLYTRRQKCHDLEEYGKDTLDDTEHEGLQPPVLKTDSPSMEGIGSVAWMVVSGDSLHNITDGMAVGAAFRADLVSGLATAIAVLTHELPHELGDFAVLLKSGMTVKQAIVFNVLSSVLSFIGMIAGVLIGNFESGTSYIYCVTAGCFLYIGLADLIPELHKYRCKGDDVIPNLIFQLSGIFCGAAIMFLIALYEHSLYHVLAGE